MIDVSVVIPTYNARDQIASALAMLDEHDGTFEVIVVDDGSTDGTAEMLEGARLSVPLRVLRERRRGRAVARNLGAAEARGRILLFIDADTRPTPGLVAAHARHYRHEDRLGVQGRTLQHPETLRTTFMRAMYLLPDLSPRSRRNLSITHVTARNLSVTRRAFQEVGGFDEAFGGYGYEDTDLALRLRQVGVRFLYEPAALVYHTDVEELADVISKRREAGENAVYFWNKHGRPTGLGFFLEIHPVLLPLKWLMFRTDVFRRLFEAVRPWAERHDMLPVCSECYNHLIWRAFYEGVYTALRERKDRRPAVL